MTEDKSSIVRGTNKPLHGRGYTTAEGAFRVPTIMWWPGTIPAGTVCDELATTMDFLPTFAEISGGKIPNDRIIDGQDIRPLILGAKSAKSPYEVFYYYYAEQLQAVRSGPWKLFLPLKDFNQHPHFSERESSKPLLFNVVNDPSSTINRAGRYPDIVDQLMDLAEKAREDLGDMGLAGANQRIRGEIENPVPVTMGAFAD
jgi:arylsulfatase A-like enzyme